MPRYYFHLTDGKQVLNNHKGIDLSGNDAVDEHGHKVDEVPIADV